MSNDTDQIDIPNKLYCGWRSCRYCRCRQSCPTLLGKGMGMTPHRSNSGQRLYRKVDIVYFLKIKHLIHTEGYTIGGAKQALQANEHTAIHTKQLTDLHTKLQESSQN